jgi:hypothetical protein
MISAQLVGGLSNQMFQIAAVYALAKDHNDVCAFPLDRTEMGQGHTARTYRSNIFSKIQELPSGWRAAYRYNEPSLNYIPIPYKRDMEIKGYFPSERYFAHRKAEILDLFKNQEIINTLQRSYAGVLKDSVSIHVRRGDYLNTPTVLPVKPLSYYLRALQYIEERAKIKHIIVCSDDIRWCRRNFSDSRIEFIDYQLDYADMYLMSLCSHNIIPNSGFGQWVVLLNSNPNKIAVVPTIWFGSGGPQGVTDNYTKEMIKI